jgi:hypothetical protein
VSDLAKWLVHGPEKTLKSEVANWDRDRQDWQAPEHLTVASFHPDGTISNTDAHNPDGTIAHSRWLRDDAGRTIESHSWMNDGPVGRTVYVYDEGGRPIRTAYVGQDGTCRDVEVYSYDSDGRRMKVQFLPRRESNTECSTGEGPHLIGRAFLGYVGQLQDDSEEAFLVEASQIRANGFGFADHGSMPGETLRKGLEAPVCVDIVNNQRPVWS